MTTTQALTKVAWRRSKSTYNLADPTAVHLVAADPTKTLCGVTIPREAREGYVRPPGLHFFEIHVYAMDCADRMDFETEQGDGYHECKRCARKAAS